MTNPTSFGERLRLERKKHGLSAEALATACGVSRSYITLIEGQKRLPGKKILPKITVALNLTTTEVLNWYLEELSARLRRNLDL